MNKKKILLLTIPLLIFSNIIKVKADTINVSNEEELLECVTEDNTCILSNDITVNKGITINKNITIELNGNELKYDYSPEEGKKYFFYCRRATLTINNNGNKGKIISDMGLFNLLGSDSNLILNNINMKAYIKREIYDSTASFDTCSAIYGMGNITINGGSIYSKNSICNGEALVGKSSSYDINLGLGNLIIKEVKFNSKILISEAYMDVHGNYNILIDGGTFEDMVGIGLTGNSTIKYNININNGTFNELVDIFNGYTIININGGTFNNDLLLDLYNKAILKGGNFFRIAIPGNNKDDINSILGEGYTFYPSENKLEYDEYTEEYYSQTSQNVRVVKAGEFIPSNNDTPKEDNTSQNDNAQTKEEAKSTNIDDTKIDKKEDNAKETQTNTKSNNEAKVNPKTGDILIYIAWIIGLGAISYSVYYFRSIKTKKAEN